MISIKQFMECIGYRITEGAQHQWSCYGYNAYSISSDNVKYSVTIVFDTKTQEVFEVSVWDTMGERGYRMISPAYVDLYKRECELKNIPFDVAFDDYVFTDLEVDDDFLEKALAIVNGKEYDLRIQVPLTLPDDQMLGLMTMAHEADLTLNSFVEKILVEEINRREQLTKEAT